MIIDEETLTDAIDLDAVRAALAELTRLCAGPWGACRVQDVVDRDRANDVVRRLAPALLAEIDRLRARVAEVEGERNDARRDAAIWQGVAERERERCAEAAETTCGTFANTYPDAGDAAAAIRALPAPEART